MTTLPEMRTCKMCRMDIPAHARKCPYCHHFQNKLSLFFFSPYFHILVLFMMGALYCGLLGVMYERFFDQGESFRNYSSEIKVVSSALQFGEGANGPTVAVVGQMANDSDVDWKEVRFQVEFHDASGKLIDAGQAYEYLYYLPAHDQAAFKVSFHREFPEGSYASHSVKVITARDGRIKF